MAKKKQLEKATFPTSTYEVFCDFFNTKLKAQFHDADGEQKLKIKLGAVEEEDDFYSLSLYREDVEALGNFLMTVSKHVQSREV